MRMPRAAWSCLILLMTCGCASAQQPIGTLSGRIVYTSAGHGWTYHNASDKWYTQRGDNNDLVEDYGNLDQMNMFVPPPVLAQVSNGATSATVSWSSIPGARYRVQ